MTLENLKKHHARLKWLASGEFTERDFDYTIKATDNPLGEKGESGRMTQGDFVNKTGQKRKDLIVFKAKRALKIFEEKHPSFKEVEKKETNAHGMTQDAVNEKERVEKKETKSKEKK